MSLLSHQWLWLSMECYGLTMHGEYVCVCVFEPLKDTAFITYVMGRFKGACVCTYTFTMYVSDGIFINVNNFRNIMNYAVEEAKNIERYNFSFMRATKSRVHKKYNVCNFPRLYTVYFRMMV